MRTVAYYRVSTSEQGRSGLGLEAQKTTVGEYLLRNGATLVAEFTEVESGGRNDRPQLQAALKRAALSRATLVIAKLDRLSRNAAFLLTLRDAGTDCRKSAGREARQPEWRCGFPAHRLPWRQDRGRSQQG